MDNEQLINSLNQFHFLRPKMLWFFVLIFLFLVQYIINNKKALSWQRLIKEELRSIVILNQKNRKANFPAILMFICVGMSILGLAGPTFKQKKLPTVINKAVVWVALDLSQSMMTKDLSPNRLERSKLKIRDLFAEKLNTKVGLLVFAGTPHVIFPPSLDKEIMVPYMTTVKPRIMPVKGTNYTLMLEYMHQLTKEDIAPPTVIIVTDELTNSQSQQIINFKNTSKAFVQVWVASSFNGGFVPNPYNDRRDLIYKGKNVLSKADQSILDQLKKEENIDVIPLTLDDSDVDVLAAHIKKHRVIKTNAERKEEDWKDDGIYLIYPLVILVLLWFRKGFMVNWGFILLLFLGGCGDKANDLWYSKDYQGQLMEQKGDYAAAAALYKDKAHKAFAYYKSGNLDEAISVYESDTTATSQYNLGLVFAEMGDYEMAQAAFKVALAKDSTLAAAQQSLTKVKVLIEQKNGTEKGEDSLQKDTSQAIKVLTEKERKLSDNKYNKKKENQADREKEKVVDPKKRKYKEQDWPDEKKKKKQSTQINAATMVMEKTNADPSEFLRKKFILQKKKYYPKVKNPEKQW